MKKKQKQEQSDRFIQTAKEHGCDESEKDFAEKLKKLAALKPKTDKKA